MSIFHGDVVTVERLQALQARAQVRGLLRRQPVLREPSANERVDGHMIRISGIVIPLERVHQRERAALVGVERTAGGLRVDRDQHREEVLDAAMTVAQQPERLVESVIRPLSDLDGHAFIVHPEP